MVLTLEERVFLVECYFREKQCTAGVREQFSKNFLKRRCQTDTTVRALIEKFHETGSVCDIKRSGRPTVLTEDKLLNVSDSVK
jgi:hypothetical protein